MYKWKRHIEMSLCLCLCLSLSLSLSLSLCISLPVLSVSVLVYVCTGVAGGLAILWLHCSLRKNMFWPEPSDTKLTHSDCWYLEHSAAIMSYDRNTSIN